MHSGAALIDVMLQFSLNGGTSIHSALPTTAADIWLHELKSIWLIVLILKFSNFFFFCSTLLCFPCGGGDNEIYILQKIFSTYSIQYYHLAARLGTGLVQ